MSPSSPLARRACRPGSPSLERKGVTLAILDTPGAEGAASSGAMQVADLNIVPSRPSLFDLRASARTCAALEAIEAEFVFLLNQCPSGQTAQVQDCVETLEEMGELISPAILMRADYQEAARHGWGVTELNPDSAAAREMRGLWESIRGRSGARQGRAAGARGGVRSRRAASGLPWRTTRERRSPLPRVRSTAPPPRADRRPLRRLDRRRHPAHGCEKPRDHDRETSPWGRTRRPFEVGGRLMKFPKGLRLRLEFAALWLGARHRARHARAGGLMALR